jgi:hypothetical protein
VNGLQAKGKCVGFADLVEHPFGGKKPGSRAMTLKKTLEEMQGGLLLIMDAVKKGNTQEAERLLPYLVSFCCLTVPDFCEILNRTVRHASALGWR